MDSALQTLIDKLPADATFYLSVGRDSHGRLRFDCCVASLHRSTPLMISSDSAESAAAAAIRYFTDENHGQCESSPSR